MPHIRIDRFIKPSEPFEYEGVKFEWYARNLEYPNEGLIGIETEGARFLLHVKPKDGGVLIKGEKITRPSPNALLKKALGKYIECFNPKVLYENISNMERIKLSKPTEALKKIWKFDTASLPDKPLWVEIGFGSGRHLVHQAKTNPDVHLIGIEIHRPSLEQVMRRIELESLENLWVVDYDARLFMELLPADRVERIFIHFPVPWDKRPHRRVISNVFVKESLRVLKPGGTLELRTDSENYVRYAIETFMGLEELKMTLCKNLDSPVRSKYEDRWRRLEKNIYEIHVESLKESKQSEERFDFTFSKAPSLSTLFSKKPAKAWIREDFFVHIERFYAINKDEGMVRLSFGSFDRPEHKFILIRNEKALYYPHAPVATKTNFRAHQMIAKWIENAECN